MLQTNYLHKKFELIDSNGWVTLDLPQAFCHTILSTAKKKYNENLFQTAVITEVNKPITNLIRSDATSWIEANTTDTNEMNTLNFLQQIQTELSQFFRIGLTHFECHYAVYKPGHFYKKHIDQTAFNNHRFFSFVIYLNENWAPADGGQLVGYNKDQVLFEIQPQFGTMILFKSDLEHEVLIGHRDRWSLTGWFRK